MISRNNSRELASCFTKIIDETKIGDQYHKRRCRYNCLNFQRDQYQSYGLHFLIMLYCEISVGLQSFSTFLSVLYGQNQADG